MHLNMNYGSECRLVIASVRRDLFHPTDPPNKQMPRVSVRATLLIYHKRK